MSDRFASFPVGHKKAFDHRVTAEEVQRFAELSGDTNPVHLDPEYAARTPLGRPVVHGMLTAAFVSRLIGKYLPGEGALWIAQTFEFSHPVYAGDILSIEAEVRQRSESQRVLVLDIRVRNQSGQVVLSGEGKVRVAEPREDPPAGRPRARVALVTGASRGIGAACALRLAQAGHAVAVNYASDTEGAARTVAEIVRRGGKSAAFACDVRDGAGVERMIEAVCGRWGGLSVLVNNAGSPLRLTPAAELTWEEMAGSLEMYLKAALLTGRAAYARFREQGGGAIVNLGSTAADSRPPAKFAAYAVAKEAVWALTKHLAAEWGADGVRVNLVSPGMTETALIAGVSGQARLAAKLDAPLRRLATPEDVAEAVAFLAGEGAAHVTGENLRVCGGAVML